jgi:hypothetical protein
MCFALVMFIFIILNFLPFLNSLMTLCNFSFQSFFYLSSLFLQKLWEIGGRIVSSLSMLIFHSQLVSGVVRSRTQVSQPGSPSMCLLQWPGPHTHHFNTSFIFWALTPFLNWSLYVLILFLKHRNLDQQIWVKLLLSTESFKGTFSDNVVFLQGTSRFYLGWGYSSGGVPSSSRTSKLPALLIAH